MMIFLMVRRDVCVCDVSASSQKNEDFLPLFSNKRVVLKRKSTTQSPLFVRTKKVLFKETPTSLRNHRLVVCRLFCFQKRKEKNTHKKKKMKKKRKKEDGLLVGRFFFGHVDFTFSTRAPKTTLMQLVSKLFLAFWALIAVAQFASGATTYSGLKDVAKITVGVTGVAHGDGCTPKVHIFTPSRGNPH